MLWVFFLWAKNTDLKHPDYFYPDVVDMLQCKDLIKSAVMCIELVTGKQKGFKN